MASATPHSTFTFCPFLASEYHCPSTSTKLYFFVTEAHVRDGFARGCTRRCSGWDSNPWPAEPHFEKYGWM